MHEIQLYDVSRRAAHWRDLSAPQQYAEIAIKVAGVAAALLLITGMALGIYFAVTTGHEIFILHPVLFGPFGVVMSLMPLALNFERSYGKADNLPDETAQKNLAKFLATKELDDIYIRYYKKNGGLRPLVRKGFMLPEHADKLRELFKEYDEKIKLKNHYLNQGSISKEIEANRYPFVYSQTCNRLNELNDAWKEIREEIKAHYGYPSEPESEDKSAPPEVMPEPRLMHPTKAASKWEDRDAQLIRNMRMVKIALLVGIIFGLFCIAALGYVASIPDDLAHILGGEFGAMACIGESAMAISLIILEYEMRNRKKVKDKPYIRDDKISRLTTEDIENVHAHYYNKEVGLTPLVQNGYLTVEQGSELSELLHSYDENSKALKIYENDTDSCIHDIKENPELSPSYHTLLEKKAEIEDKWSILSPKIKDNFRQTPEWCSLPNEILQHILSYLKVNELESVSKVNRLFASCVQATLSLRAKEYGITFAPNSNKPFYKLFGKICTLTSDGYLPKTSVVFNKRLCFKAVDGEATLRNMRVLSSDKAEALKSKLGKALLKYTRNGDVAMVEALLNLGAHTESRDEITGMTALNIACWLHCKKIVELLIEKGADTNTLDYNGQSPLIYVSCNYNFSHAFLDLDIARLLLENGAALTINHRSNNGAIPLHFAAYRNYAELVELLLAYGAQKNMVDALNNTAAFYARGQKVRELLQN